jgi:hypothetical protein
VADAGQSVAGAIHDFALIANTTANLFRQLLTWFNASHDVSQQGELLLQPTYGALHSLARSQGALNVEQVHGLEKGPTDSMLSKWPNIVYPAQRHADLGIEQRSSLSRLLQPLLNLSKHRHWLQSQRRLPTGGEGGVLR